MAERRMFTQKITESDAFLEMPMSAQALYFHLCMNADDDGFVKNPKRLQKLVGCNDDDIKILIFKNFVLPFESGIIVIKHWRMHNLLRKDRYIETEYQEEKSQLYLKENGAYTFDKKQGNALKKKSSGNQMATKWQPTDNQLAPQDSIGKDSIVKDNININTINSNNILVTPEEQPVSENPHIITDEEEIFIHWNAFGIVKHQTLTEKILKAIQKALALYGRDKIKEGIANYAKVYLDQKYFFSYKWTLEEFLKQANALPDFFIEGNKWKNYNESRKQNEPIQVPGQMDEGWFKK